MKNKITVYLFVFLLLTITITLFSCYQILKYISQQTKTNILYFPNLIKQAYSTPSFNTNFNFIILGLDPRDDLLEKSTSTDTIILGNYSFGSEIKLISIPRDLWDYTLNTKINQIYPLSLEKSNKFDFIQLNYSRLTGQNIDRTVVITTQNLIDLIKIVGGVDVNLENGFIDNFYPNPAYIANPSPKIPKYITVEFPKGMVHLDGNNITEFIRSRKSSDTVLNGGTDIGRIKRQQLLINSLINKLKSEQIFTNYQTIISLYNYWHSQIISNISDKDIVYLGLKTYDKLNRLSIKSSIIPTAEEPEKQIIYHPLKFINKQWVYIPEDVEYKSFQKFISNTLNDSF